MDKDRPYLIRTDASDATENIQVGIRRITSLKWDIRSSPDGTRLVYVTSRHQDGKGFDLEMSNLDGSNRRRLTEHAGPLGGAPDWSPDGTLIAFANYHLGVIGTDGQNERLISAFPGLLETIRVEGQNGLPTDKQLLLYRGCHRARRFTQSMLTGQGLPKCLPHLLPPL